MGSCGELSRLGAMSSFIFMYFLVELVVGYYVNSISLVADAFHMFSDLLSIFIGIAAIRISTWPQSSKNTFGWQRAEIMGSMINAVVLVTLCMTIIFDAIERFLKAEPVEQPKLMFWVGLVGMLINVVGLIVLGSHSHGHGHSHGGTNETQIEPEEEDEVNNTLLDMSKQAALTEESEDFTTTSNTKMSSGGHENCHLVQCKSIKSSTSSKKKTGLSMNMQAVFLHVLADFFGSLIVVVSALILWLVPGDVKTNASWKLYIDPSMSIIMVIIILSSVLPLLKKSALILLQSVPSEVCIRNLKSRMSKIDGVIHVHDLHVWRLQSTVNIGTVHVRCHNIDDYVNIAKQVKQLFHDANVHCTTIQPEFDHVDATVLTGDGCFLDCGPKNCAVDSCCPKTSDQDKDNQNSKLVSNLPIPLDDVNSSAAEWATNTSTNISMA